MMKVFPQRMCCLFAQRVGRPAVGLVFSPRTALCKPIIHHAYRGYIRSSNEFSVIGNVFLLRNKHSIAASDNEVKPIEYDRLLESHMDNFEDEIPWTHIRQFIASI